MSSPPVPPDPDTAARSPEAGPESIEHVFEGPLFGVEVRRQLREAVGRALLEIPPGIYDRAGEPPDAAIRREIVDAKSVAALLLAGRRGTGAGRSG